MNSNHFNPGKWWFEVLSNEEAAKLRGGNQTNQQAQDGDGDIPEKPSGG